MAKEYFEKLRQLVAELGIENEVLVNLETKHFFGGAALYANGNICASWSPAGLAFKLSDSQARRLIDGGSAKPLKYFATGNVKKGYVLFEQPEKENSDKWKDYFLRSIQQTY